jgi:hypothetical protein
LFVAFQHASGLGALTSAWSADKDHTSGFPETHDGHGIYIYIWPSPVGCEYSSKYGCLSVLR